MVRILITGSSDGLGLLAAQQLVQNGHKVVVHGRNTNRAAEATKACPGAERAVIGDLSSIEETKKLAADINKLGAFDCVIHNAGLFRGTYRKTSEGMASLPAVNVVAPYLLTCLIQPRPKRLIYLSSQMHHAGKEDLKDITWEQRGEEGFSDSTAYCDSKLHDIMLAKAFARRWPDVKSNAIDPGWVATKMGGAGAPDSPKKAIETYIMLAEGQNQSTGKYFRPGKSEDKPKVVADNTEAQDKLLEILAERTGVQVPS